MLYHHFRNYGCRINTNYFFKDLRVAVLENEFLRVSILIDKGTDIFEFLYKPKDIDFMWLSPWGINSPSKFISSIPSKEGNFMDFYEGGWQEILPNSGRGSNYRGAEEGLHGELSLIPWDFQVLEDKPDIVQIKFMVRTYRTPFYLEKILTLKKDDPKLYIEEKLKNEGYADIQLMWTHHPTIGGIFLDDSLIIDLPDTEIEYVRNSENQDKYSEIKKDFTKWPIFKGYNGEDIDFSKSPTIVKKGSMEEICIKPKEGWYAITNIEKEVGFGMNWNLPTFPFIWLWRMYGEGADYAPWWGRVCCMALELCSSFSSAGLEGAIKNNTAIRIKPQQEINTSFMAIAYERNSEVTKIDNYGKVI